MRAKFGERYYSHTPVSTYTTSGLGGVADYLVIVKTVEELMVVAQIGYEHQVSTSVLGGGSGILVSDTGFAGLIIVNQTRRLLYLSENTQLVVDSGVANDELINLAAARGWGGLEWLASVPGTIGGAIG